jgi:hypothetical protein
VYLETIHELHTYCINATVTIKTTEIAAGGTKYKKTLVDVRADDLVTCQFGRERELRVRYSLTQEKCSPQQVKFC